VPALSEPGPADEHPVPGELDEATLAVPKAASRSLEEARFDARGVRGDGRLRTRASPCGAMSTGALPTVTTVTVGPIRLVQARVGMTVDRHPTVTDIHLIVTDRH
jgi:hypothetical protein